VACCSVSQRVVVCVAACCSVLSVIEQNRDILSRLLCCSVLQRVAACCSVLQYVVLCCSVLQCAAEKLHDF